MEPGGSSRAEENGQSSQNVNQKGRVQKEKLLEIINPPDVFTKEGKIQVPKHEIWETYSTALQEKHIKMTPKHVWVFLNKNRHGITSVLREACGLPEITHEKTSKDPETEAIRPEHTFIGNIASKDWKNMKPVKREIPIPSRPGKTRSVVTLPPGSWAHILTKVFWDQHEFPCPIVFKRAVVCINPDLTQKFIQFEDGHCAECGGKATAWIDVCPDVGASAIVKLRATDTRGVVHQKRRQLRGTERTEYMTKVLGSGVTELIRSEAVNKTSGNVTAPNLYGPDVLRKALQQKREDRLKSLGIPLEKDQFKSLLIMKNTQPFVGSIHMVCQDPVTIIYNTPSQLLFSKDICKAKYSRMSVDATGDIVLQVNNVSGRSRKILLYQLMGTSVSGSVPLNQMLSERQHANIIQFWLNEGIRRGSGIPNEVVCDDSKAIVVALARSFADCSSARAYIDQCFGFLTNEEKKLPRCFIRNDFGHLNKAVAKWKCFQTASKKDSRLVKEHIMRWFNLLTKTTCLENYKETLCHVFTLTLSETIGTAEEPNAATHSKIFLINEVSGESDQVTCLDSASEDSDAESWESDSDSESFSEATEKKDPLPSIQKWIQSIYDEAYEKVDDAAVEVNPYFLPSFAESLRKLANRFVLWSSVLVPAFGSPYPIASSAHNEGYFYDLKNNVFKEYGLPTTCNKFVGVQLHSVEGQLTLQSTRIREDRSKEQLDDSQEELNETENWRGQGTPGNRHQAQTSNSKYMQIYPSIIIESEMMCLAEPKKLLLRNGNLTPFVVLADGRRVKVSNTCGFDAIVQIFAVGMLDYPKFRRKVGEYAKSSPTLSTAWSLAHEGETATTLSLRVGALLPKEFQSCQKQCRKDDIISIDIEGNLQTLVKSLDLGFSSLKFKLKCPLQHKDTIFKQQVTVIEDTLVTHGIKKLEDALILSDDGPCLKKSCKHDSSCVTTAGSILLIDSSFDSGHKSSLSDVPLDLEVFGKKYILVGLVAFQPRHYVTYVRRLNGYYELYNDVNRHAYKVKSKALVYPELMVYTSLH